MNRKSAEVQRNYDVVILGAGLAGLTLARHLLLETDKTILLLERREEIPPRRQKVGEATVQLGGYYLSKVLDLEEHLLREHFMKYNLRFFWKSAGRANDACEDYSQSYIRPFSNLASYQLDRNKIEAELLRLNRGEERCSVVAPTRDLSVSLAEEGPHTVVFTHHGAPHRVTADWVVDTTGRNRVLAKELRLSQSSPIHHGAYFLWVEGLVNVEKLTSRTPREIRINKDRQATGHLPQWLATNHFAGEGFWLWVIPLQGRTSLGVVFDSEVFPWGRVSSPEKFIDWICEEFPLFARDLPHRQTIDFAGFKSFAHSCAQTIHPAKWALSGESGRFSDPLYSPGSDLIAMHNTLIVDAIQGEDSELEGKCQLYERVMRTVYQAYLPSYTLSYDTLGDQETFSLKYTWELTVYFAGYVFPFINDLFTERRFLLAFLRLFSRLGPINQAIQSFLSSYYQWKKKTGQLSSDEPVFYDFTEVRTLREAERTFYKVGISVGEAKEILARQVGNLEELARFIVVYTASRVLDDERVLTNRRFVSAVDIYDLRFDPEAMGRSWTLCCEDPEIHQWSLDPQALSCFRNSHLVASNQIEELAAEVLV